MKVGDIKVEAIKLMFANYAFDIVIEDLQRMISDENYGSYIVNMNGSIARAIDRIQNACVVPVKSKIIGEKELVKGRNYIRFDMAQINDFYLIDRLVAEDSSGNYIGNADYQLEGSTLILESGLNYTLLYFPTLKSVDDSVSDMDEMWLPNYIARLIPLYIKGDLYQEEEPSLAADARNTFEMSLEDLKSSAQSKQNHIKRVL